MRRLLFCIALVPLAVSSARASVDTRQRGGETPRAIVRVAGDVYRVQAGTEATVFVVGSDGILIADPLDLETAKWLKAELDARFPGRPVAYMVEAGTSLNRIGGGAMFKPEAMTVGHDGYTRELLRALKGQPPALAKFVSYPQEMFTTGTRFTVGGKAIQIINAGEDYWAESALILFVEDRVLFTWSPRIGTVPFGFNGAKPRDVLKLVQTIGGLQFDTLITSNGQTLGRAEVDRLVAYVDHLRAEVAGGIKGGRSAIQMAAVSVPAQFRDDRQLAGRSAQLSAMFDGARVTWTDLHGAFIYSWFDRNADYCEGFPRCESGARVIGGSGGLRVGNRRFGVVAEMTGTQQFLQVRESGVIDEVFAHRQTRGSVLFSLGGTRLKGPSFNLLAGVTYVVGDSDGVRKREGLAPAGGRRPVVQRSSAFGVTVGMDLLLPISNHVGLVLPLRATMIDSPPQELWPGKFDAQAGAGLRFNLHRSVR